MRIVSPILKNVVYPSIAKAGLFHRFRDEGLAVVTYHGVTPSGYEPIDSALDGNLVSADFLRRHLRLLKAHFNVVAPEDALAWIEKRGDLPPRAVLLTCDDGLLNCLTEMLPVLNEAGLRCLFFATGASAGMTRRMLWYEDLFLTFLQAQTGKFGICAEGITIEGEFGSPNERRALWWIAVKKLSNIEPEAREAFVFTAREKFGLKPAREILQSPEQLRRFGLMTVDELRDLAAAGMTIGAHTHSHPMLSQAPSALAYAEIAGSRSSLESALGSRVWAFAYPFGDSQSVTPEVLAMPREAGFTAAFLNFGGGLGVPLPRYALPRLHVTSGMRTSEFEAHISGFYAWLQRCSTRKSNPVAA
jgi:peptidoglycan/xylan/chitin deacetylase (PgdA/CDA1 family)